jgi:hypothetical protein
MLYAAAASSSILWSAVGALAAVAAFLLAFLVWYVPQRDIRRKEREHSQRVRDALLGVEAAPGVLARPGLVQQVDELVREIRPNAGGSLHDRVVRMDKTLAERTELLERIDEKTTEAVEQGKTAVTVAAEAKSVASATSDKLDQTHELLLKTRDDVVVLHDYTHDGLHAIVGAMTTIAPGIDVIVTLAKKFENPPKRLEN